MTPDLASYDVIVVNSSAGKDSQAMLDRVVELADRLDIRRRLVVLHCDLGLSPKGQEIEWPGTKELAKEHAEHYGLRFVMVRRGTRGFLEEIDYRGKMPADAQRYSTSKFKMEPAATQITALAKDVRTPGFIEQIDRLGHFPKADTRNCTSSFKREPGEQAMTRLAGEVAKSGLTTPEGFLEQVEHRGMWSSQTERLCTSNNKREPANQGITTLAGEARVGKRTPRILQCFGFRSEESPRRRKMRVFENDKRISTGRKHVDRWLPIQDWTLGQVWARNKAAGTRHHPAYDQGMARLSCRFCIFAPKHQLMLSAKLNPELFDEYVQLEIKIGHRFRKELSLVEVKQAIEAGEEIKADDGAWNM
jgi:3'-phosphoadenosine 5'-phosphosulfate sulfotransferase (PAPS reductase)/FAD synthetase